MCKYVKLRPYKTKSQQWREKYRTRQHINKNRRRQLPIIQTRPETVPQLQHYGTPLKETPEKNTLRLFFQNCNTFKFFSGQYEIKQMLEILNST